MRRTHPHLRRLLPAGALVASGLSLCGCSGHGTAEPAPTNSTALPHSVTFQVTGSGYATLTWAGGSAKRVHLPWHQAMRTPVGSDGLSLTVQLEQAGGSATCAISVDGRRVVSSLAQGAYGRATCHTGGAAQGDD